MTEPIFLDRPADMLHFEKVGGVLTPVSDNAQMWPQEILSEAYRQLPFLSEFTVDIALDRTNEENGFAFGSLIVRPPTQMTADEESKNPITTLHIPVIVREHKLSQLDVFLADKAYRHLTEGRVRQALFRPEIFDAVRERPYEPSLFTNLIPPLESNIAGGGFKTAGDKTADLKSSILKMLGRRAPEYVPVERIAKTGLGLVDASGTKAAKTLRAASKASKAAAPAAEEAGRIAAERATKVKPLRSAAGIRGTKVASVLPILPQLDGRIRADHASRLRDSVTKEATLRSAYLGAHPGVRAAVDGALALNPPDLEKSAAAILSSVPPTVVQLRKLASGGVRVKWANAEMYAPQQQQVPESVAQEMVGDLDLVGNLEADGSITASPDVAVKQTLEADEIRSVDQFGIWLVQEVSGVDLTGFAFPQVMSLDLQPLPLVLFTNGSQYCLQEKIAGKLIGKSTDIPKGLPRGMGAFYYLDHGTAKAFVPMRIVNEMRDETGLLSYRAQLATGEEATVCMAEGLKTVVKMGEGEYCVPSHFSWLPLKTETELVHEPMLFSKVAHASIGEVISDGSVYHFRGPPFAKLATNQYQFLDRLEAEFLGVAAGVTPKFIKTALDATHTGKAVQLGGLRVMQSAAWALQSAQEKVARDVRELGVRNYFLVKEALVLDDAMTADKILGLGFINAENVQTFVDMLPSLEATSSKLAELLVAVRLGIKDIPEAAIERMLVAMEDVIQGLHRLRQREVTFRDTNPYLQ